MDTLVHLVWNIMAKNTSAMALSNKGPIASQFCWFMICQQKKAGGRQQDGWAALIATQLFPRGASQIGWFPYKDHLGPIILWDEDSTLLF